VKPQTSFFFLFFLLSVSWVALSSARLIGKKHLVNTEAVVNRKLFVQYQIFNVGNSTAYNVSLVDTSFADDQFEVISGFLEANFDRLAAGSNLTHVVVLRPKTAFNYQSERAIVEYQSSPNGEKEWIYTTDLGTTDILSRSESERRVSPHLAEWAVFLVLCILTVLPAGLVFGYYQLNYDKGIPKKKHDKLEAARKKEKAKAKAKDKDN